MRHFQVVKVQVSVTRDEFEKVTGVAGNFPVEADNARDALRQVANLLTDWAQPLIDLDEELMVEVVGTVVPAPEDGEAIRMVLDVAWAGSDDDAFTVVPMDAP